MWKEVLRGTRKQIAADHVEIVAAGVAFYSLLSIPFVLTAIVSVYGLIADPAQVQEQVAALEGLLPQDALGLISEQLTRVSAQPGGALTFALIGSLFLALWSGSKAVKAVITALNIAYDETEKRGFLKLNLSAIGLTLAGVVAAVVAIALVVGIPALIDRIGISGLAKNLSTTLRWPLLAIFALLGLSAIYRYGPSREKPRWRWVSWGSAGATALWLFTAALFSWYVSSFGKYNETYGSLGGVVITLMWFYITAFVVMVGAELNAEIESRARKGPMTGGRVDPFREIPESGKSHRRVAG